MFIANVPPIRYQDPWPVPFENRLRDLTSRERRVAYYYSALDNSTFRYRCYNMVQAISHGSADTSASYFFRADEDRLAHVADLADVIVLARVQYDLDVERFVDRARRRNAVVLFDLDDLVFDSKFAPLLMHSLNQSLGWRGPWDYWYAYMGRIGSTLALCDGAVTTNAFLAAHLKAHSGRNVAVVPNFLNREQMEVSDRIWMAKKASKFARDEHLNLGYFSGSPSHARDFAILHPVLTDLCDTRADIRVRLAGYLDPSFTLTHHPDRIDVLPFTDFINLQRFIGATELNLAPLQDNIFTNGKSELKFFEAALVGTITVASPTAVFREAIEPGRTGFLANELDWRQQLEAAIKIIEGDPAERLIFLERARNEVISRYGFQNQWPAIERALFHRDP